MPYFAVALAFAAALAIVLLSRRATRENHAGITTTRAGRVLRTLGLSLRLAANAVRRRLLRLFVSRAAREARDRALEQEAARDALSAMGNMKGALMKLGQIISFMDEALPEAYRTELAKLQSQAPPMAWELVEATIRLELGDDPDALFAGIERAPLASASIGQVHRAVLRDGTRVAVKVQYPGVDQAISADLDNYALLSGMMNAVTPTMDAGPIVAELRARLVEELDYRREAENQEHFRSLYASDPDIVIPRVYPALSSRRVLTTELVEGGRGFYDFAAKAPEGERRRAALAIYRFAFDSIYDHYVFNGDPHPGNYLFLEGGRVAFLDFGCVKQFGRDFVEDLRGLNALYLTGDRAAFYEKMVAMRYVLPSAVDRVSPEWLWDYMRYYYLPVLEDRPFLITAEYCKEAVGAMFGPAMRRLNMPGDFVLLNRINFGLNSIFARLAVTENWHARSRRHFLDRPEAGAGA